MSRRLEPYLAPLARIYGVTPPMLRLPPEQGGLTWRELNALIDDLDDLTRQQQAV